VHVASDRNRPLVEWRPGVRTRLDAAGSTGAEQLCFMHQFCDPGAGAPAHRHDGVEEAIVVIAGRARFRVDDEEAELEAGESVLIPGGVRHAFTNVGDEVLRIVAVFAAATPPVEYEDEPGVLEIGSGATERRDAHRAYRNGEA
jgi:quercetin dioxygenase-like cupin family protein